MESRPERGVAAHYGRVYLANISGSITDITDEVAGTQAINWVAGNVPSTDRVIPEPNIAPVGERTIANPYAAGQRLRVLAVNGLFIRNGPSQNAEAIGSVVEGDVVLMLASQPVREGSLIWWEIRTETPEIVGWIAGEIDGAATIGP